MKHKDLKFISSSLNGFNLENSVAVSDTFNYTCGAGARCVFDKDKGKVYLVYNASKNSYGEQRDELCLSIFSIVQPTNIKYINLLSHNQEIDGVKYDHPDVPSIVFIDGIIRVYFLCRQTKGRTFPEFDETAQYFYIDYDIKTENVSKPLPVRIKWGKNEPVELTALNYKKYMEEMGYNVNTTTSIEMEEFNMNTGKIVKNGESYYSVVTSVSTLRPVVWKSSDCKTLEFINVLPQQMRYECCFEIVKDVMYFIMRESGGANFYASYDFGKTFIKSKNILPIAKTRPWLCEYNGELLICLSKEKVKPNFIREGRNNLYIYKGTGLNFKKYKKILEYVNPYGILYYEVFNYKGVINICYSNSELYIDKVLHGNVQGKDMVKFGKIGYVLEK